MHPKIMIGNENDVNLSYVLVSPLHLINSLRPSDAYMRR